MLSKWKVRTQKQVESAHAKLARTILQYVQCPSLVARSAHQLAYLTHSCSVLLIFKVILTHTLANWLESLNDVNTVHVHNQSSDLLYYKNTVQSLHLSCGGSLTVWRSVVTSSLMMEVLSSLMSYD